MRHITSRIDTGSGQYRDNTAAYAQLVETLRERQEWAISGGPGRERSIERHLSRGKIPVRDRIDRVIDDDTPFLELSTLSGYGQYDDAAPGGGIITGIGTVHGVPYVSAIPLLGKLFSRTGSTEEQRNLLVFVTATVLSERGESLRAKPMPLGALPP